MSFTSRHAPSLLVAVLLLSACAPLSTATDVDPLTAEEPAVDGVGTDAAASASAAAASEAQAASESEAAARASEEAAAEAERLAAEEADREAAEKAAEEAAAEKAAEEAAAQKAAEEEAARVAAEEEARRKAEAAEKKAREVQTTLTDLGYYTGGIDGDVGPMTLAAIKDFQAVNGLKVDGKVGPNTTAALASDDARPKPPPPEPADDADDLPEGGVLSVKAAQRVLKDLRYFGGKADGKTTDSFRTALTAFQKVEGISADGSLGPQTSAHLVSPVTPTLKGGNGKRIEIDLTLQVIHVVKGGERIRTMPTSSGNGEEYDQKDGDTATALTPVGDFVIERRITGLREADLGSLYDPLYFYKGWAIHGSNSVPSYPASHGCTRVSRTDILWLADQMSNGTQVRVYGGEHTFIATG